MIIAKKWWPSCTWLSAKGHVCKDQHARLVQACLQLISELRVFICHITADDLRQVKQDLAHCIGTRQARIREEATADATPSTSGILGMTMEEHHPHHEIVRCAHPTKRTLVS